MRLHACSEARPSVALFSASTVSALHRNAHIWDAPHPPYCHSLLVMYAESLCTHQALRQKNHSERLVAGSRTTAGRIQNSLISQLHHLTKSYPLSRTVKIVGLPTYLKFKSQFCLQNGKNSVNAEIAIGLFTCYLNSMCKSNLSPVS